MESDSSIEEKQEYLRENVLEKGLDANSFADYLVSKRGEDASNIGSWSMKDLRQAVKEFIQIQESKKKESKIEEEGENENIIKKDEDKLENKINEKENEAENEIIINENNDKESKEKESIKEEKKIDKKELKKEEKKEIKNQNENKKENILPPEIYGIVSPSTYGDFKNLENSPLSSVENPIITISSPEKKEGGIFSKSYIIYLITTKDPSLNVKRRYSDFEWFHQTLLFLYPYLVIPPIPKKKSLKLKKKEKMKT